MNIHALTRRQFLKSTAVAAGALTFPLISSRNVLGANGRLNIAGIGVGGKGAGDVAVVDHENIVALCDVDEVNAAGSFKKYPHAKRYKDFRLMLDKEGQGIDAVTVSTPDHMHAPAALTAMKMGKHVYCQKPLTHTVHEARQMTEVARQHKVATQMGNQGHSNPDTRRLVELIQGGVLGKVREVHVWTDRPGNWWPQGIDRPNPKEAPKVPETLDWDLWLGVAPSRPYNPAYVPFKWRGFWDFGTGALGDMACHNMDLAFFALQLRDPISVEGQSSDVNSETAPVWSIITYEFAARGPQTRVKLIWYDGGKKPEPELAKTKELPGNGVIMIGEKDTLFVPSYWGPGAFLSGAKAADFKNIPERFPRQTDWERSHHQEWLNACKGGPKALSNFDYSGPMTEAVLLGNVALRAGVKIEWDAKKFKVTNVPEANHYLRMEYRKGWEV
ncbi:MAG: Gfo/Idh/MocA family oxidoreductase [Verrucomicrobia bacterium]|nr:Gfo/Idh/MocA family oxidoreductase [Verrucomicrobiota bacterium]